jgi:crotonobetaine/carnitine-CoA ligase
MPEQTLAAARNLWWHSGDRGHFDEDGWLYFDGRIKDVIRRRGVNISAHEVESIVDEHPAVLESAAVAVPSELSEDDIKVVVVARDGVELAVEDLLDHCIRHLPRHMVPRYVEVRQSALPRTPSEKVAKETLRAEGVTPETFDREARKEAPV